MEDARDFFDKKFIWMFVISGLLVLVGFFKRFIYIEDSMFFGRDQNYYVGGDAYNFIISSNHMIPYFILALIFALIGCTLVILNVIMFYNTTDKSKWWGK